MHSCLTFYDCLLCIYLCILVSHFFTAYCASVFAFLSHLLSLSTMHQSLHSCSRILSLSTVHLSVHSCFSFYHCLGCIYLFILAPPFIIIYCASICTFWSNLLSLSTVHLSVHSGLIFYHCLLCIYLYILV